MSEKNQEFKVGDRVKLLMGIMRTYYVYGTVVYCEKSVLYETPVQWDHIEYHEGYRYSLPSTKLLFRVTPLEELL